MPPQPRPILLALLADVKDNPADRTPWLVLTDWLEEYGDAADCARAEYCRLCLPKMGIRTTAAHFDQGERRRELFAQHKSAWLGPLMQYQPKQVDGLFHLHMENIQDRDVASMTGHDEALAWVYKITTELKSAARMAWTPEGLFRDVRELELWGNTDPNRLCALLEPVTRGRLEVLSARSPKFNETHAKRLINGGTLQRLRCLRLGAYGNDKIREEARALLVEHLGDRVSFDY